MQVRRLWLFGALIATSLGCAHTPPTAEKASLPPRMLVTGSHIPRWVDPNTGAPRTTSSVRVYGRQEIFDSGRQNDLAAALQAQVPTVY